MADRTHEQTINTALGEVLMDLGHGWKVRAERVGKIFVDGGRPDILIEKPGDWPVIIEAEVNNYRQAEIEAKSRLGKQLVNSPHPVELSVALVYPESLRRYSGKKLRNDLRESLFEYVVLSIEKDGIYNRYPTSGWLVGDLRELALLIHLLCVPTSRADSLAAVLEDGVSCAEQVFSGIHPVGSSLGKSIATVLGQSDDSGGQTRKMAMTVIADALIFHAALAEAELVIEDPISKKERPVKSPNWFRSEGNFLPTPLMDEWLAILKVNYWPIFYTARAILRSLPSQTAVTTLDILWETAEKLVAGGVTKSHDLTGIVFQRLIADRKFLATYYTRPAAAALLTTLALPLHIEFRNAKWGDSESLSRIRIGDFACGTGTLISTAYRRISLLHELYQGDPKKLHPLMMKYGLVAMDVLNIGVHLTAAMLAGSHPDTPFDGECLLTVPYGCHDWGISIGSLSLLTKQQDFDFMKATAKIAGGKGEKQVKDLINRVGHGQFDLLIMNPPFTRHGAREGDRTDVHNPAFAAFETDEREQDILSSRLRVLARGGCAHGHAGMASYFVELAHRKLADSGIMALVLPLSAMSGGSWEGVRKLWHDKYSDIRIVTISEEGTHSRSFSADTGMAECLVLAKKYKPADSVRRAMFCVINRQPINMLDGEIIGHAINTSVDNNFLRKLEDGPFGGSPIFLGEETVGEIMDCPLPEDGPWPLVGIKNIDLAQTAYQLTQGKLWLEGMSFHDTYQIPIATIGDICARTGPHDLDITGALVKSDGLPQGPFQKYNGVPEGASYPCLWNHDAKRERHLIVKPDSHCRIRDVKGTIPKRLQERAIERWKSASCIHYNRDCRFNSQSLIVAMTDRPSLGGRAWPTVILKNRDHEFTFALWCNSTLGLLCHWWSANKSQDGRGTVTISGIPRIPTLNLDSISKKQHEMAKDIFKSFRDKRLLPFDQIDEDEVRFELDKSILVDILGLPLDVYNMNSYLYLLRKKLASEPQIHSRKMTRVVFTDDGEKTVPR